jgi:Icc-related predicted phosphoesterase
MPKLPLLYVVSDLHIDTGPFEWPAAALAADIIIVAGDLANGAFDIEFLKRPNKPVVFVPGNHDFWTTDGTRDMVEMYADMKRAARGTQVHVLWDEEVELLGVRIIGTPLWTDFGGGNEELMRASFQHMRDYAYINARSWYADPDNLKLHVEQGARWRKPERADAAESGAFTPLVAYSLHQKSLAFIESRLAEAFDGRTVLVTHMAPTYLSLQASGTVREHALDPKFWQCRGRDNTDLARVASYASDLSALFERYRDRLDLAVHGHIHSTIDIVCGSTRVLANPRGRYLGPLTEESSRGFAMFGYPVSKERIAESQAAFAEYPYWGDNWGFQAQQFVRLEDGLAPVFRPLVEELLPRLQELYGEMVLLQPHVAHRTPAIRRSIQESAEARGQAFATTLEKLLRPACAAFDGHGQVSDSWWVYLDSMGLPKPRTALVPRFTSPFDKKVDPRAAMADSLQTMSELLETAKLVPEVASLACAKYMPRVEEVRQRLAARGLKPALHLLVPHDAWRKLYFNLGSVSVDASEEQEDLLEEEVDLLINGGPPPRHACLSIGEPYRLRQRGKAITAGAVSNDSW